MLLARKTNIFQMPLINNSFLQIVVVRVVRSKENISFKAKIFESQMILCFATAKCVIGKQICFKDTGFNLRLVYLRSLAYLEGDTEGICIVVT